MISFMVAFVLLYSSPKGVHATELPVSGDVLRARALLLSALTSVSADYDSGTTQKLCACPWRKSSRLILSSFRLRVQISNGSNPRRQSDRTRTESAYQKPSRIPAKWP